MATIKQGREFNPEVKKIDVGGGVQVTLVTGEIRMPEQVYNILRKDLAWERIDKTPRSEYFASDIDKEYTYGKGAGERAYQPQPWIPALKQLQREAEFWTRLVIQPCKLEVVFLNLYLDGKDQLGWHADDSPEMDDKRPIVIISLGAEREIWFRQRPSDDPLSTAVSEVFKVNLPMGSICIMPPGMQDTHQHRIPRSSLNECGPRISLTFRGYDAVQA